MFDARNVLDDGLPPELWPAEAELRATANNTYMTLINVLFYELR